MAEATALTIHTDGASRGNPGEAAFAYIIRRDAQPVLEEAGCLGQMTCNQAEYTALIRALEHALQLGVHHRVIINSDSELMVKQMNGTYRVKNEELRDLYEQASALRRRFDGPVTIHHVRREQNKRADQLCNEALDGKHSATPRQAPPSLRAEALKCLREAAAVWSRGAGEPSPEQVWLRLTELLQRHGITLPLSDN